MNLRRAMLWCGATGSALFIVLFLVNDAIKPDYSPVRDAVSEGAIGRGGWLQIVNFVVSGSLVALSSLALRRTVDRWTSGLIALAGAGLALAGVFLSDPVPAEQGTWHGMVHNVVGTVSSAALIAACFTAARWTTAPLWRWYSVAVGIAMPAAFSVAVVATESLGAWQRLTNVLGWTWLVALELRALRAPAEAPAAGIPVAIRRS